MYLTKRSFFNPNSWNRDSFDVSNIWDSLLEGADIFWGDAKYTDDDGNTTYEFEVPGFSKNNLEISVLDGVLTISGKRETRNESHAGASEIHKRFVIGESQKIDAEIKDGILYLKLKNPESKRRLIELK